MTAVTLTTTARIVSLVSIDDPRVVLRTIVGASADSGGGAVDSVDGRTGVVTLSDRYEAAGAVTTHTAASDPHGDRAFATSAISTHAGATDPHGDRSYAAGLIAALKNDAPAGGDTLAELDSRIAILEALGSLATDAELIAAVAALIGTADTAGDTLGELQALIGLRLLTANNLSDVANKATARTNLGLAVGADVQAYSATLAALAALTTTSFGRSLLELADLAALRSTLGQPWSVIADTTLGSPASALAASWAGSYSRLQLLITGRTDIAANTNTVTCQFNSDTGSNYYNTGGSGSTSMAIGVLSGSLTNTDRCGDILAEVSNESGYHHSVMSRYNAAASSTQALTASSTNFKWANTTQITSVQLAAGSASFVAGSRLTVLGRP